MSDCVICVERFVAYDYVTLMDCGHYLHNLCYLKADKPDKCPICRRMYVDTASFCINSQKFDIFDEDRAQFLRQLFFTKSTYQVAKIKRDNNADFINKIRVEKIKDAANGFFSHYLKQFKFGVLKACAENRSEAIIHMSPFGEEFMDMPVIFLLSGPRGSFETYFEIIGVESVFTKIKQYFKLSSVFLKVDYPRKKNCIGIRF